MNNKFIVQAFSNTEGWQDTKYSSDSMNDACDLALKLYNEKNHWINGKPTAVRVVNKAENNN